MSLLLLPLGFVVFAASVLYCCVGTYASVMLFVGWGGEVAGFLTAVFTVLRAMCALSLCLLQAGWWFSSVYVSMVCLCAQTCAPSMQHPPALLCESLCEPEPFDEIEVVSDYVGWDPVVICCATDVGTGGTAEPLTLADCEPVEGVLEGLLPHGPSAVVPDIRFERMGEGWLLGHHPDFTAQHMASLQSTLVDLKGCFAYSLQDLPGYTGILGPYRIDLKPDFEGKPIWTKPRPHSAAEKAVQDEKCGEMAEAGIIRKNPDTMFASEVVIAAKKDATTGEWTDRRFCVDFRPLNAAMKVDHYRLPTPDELFDSIGKARFFSKIDAKSAFMQRGIREEDQAKTSFWWNGATWCFTRCPYGLHSAPQQWQQLMDTELARGGCAGFAMAFMDDILVFSSGDDPELHIQHIKQVLLCLNGVGIKAHPTKCLFACDTVEYLGCNVSLYGLTPHEAKVAAIAALRPATNVTEVRSLLGLMNYYRRFVRDFSAIAAPLNDLLKKGVEFVWGESQQAALDELKRVLTTEGLALKRVDPNKPLILYTDWSKHGIGAVLAQLGDDGREHICACVSRSLNKHERNYGSYKGELLACVWACQVLRHYIHGRPLTLVTDHEPLQWLMANKDLTGQYARWAMIMQDFEFTVIHRKGSEHNNADVLSRMPRADDTDVTGARLDVDTAVPAVPTIQPLTVLCTMLCDCALASSIEVDCSAWDEPLSAVEGMCPSAAQLTDSILLCNAAQARASWQVSVFVSSLSPSPGAGDDLWPVGDGMCDFGSLADCNEPEPVNSPVGEQRIQQLRSDSARWHAAASSQLPAVYVESAHYGPWRPACLFGKGGVKPDSFGIKPTAAVCTEVIGSSFFKHACSDGVVVVELFGGICTGLESVLRSGLRVLNYMYSDKDPVSQRVAAHRLHQLSAQYPALLPLESFRHAFTALPQDVWRIDTAALLKAGVQDGNQWLVIAGWECSDLSPAGNGAGLHGPHSSTFFALRRVLGAIQQLQQQKPPGYLLENTFLDFDFGRVARQLPLDKEMIYSSIGYPLYCDAARFGSYAHRLRHYWTNLAAAEHLQCCVDAVERPPGLLVADILLPGRHVLPVEVSDRKPFYPCNLKSEPRSAFPTFVTVLQSRAFKPSGPGAVFDEELRGYTEPCPDEREAAMGFDQGCTCVRDFPGQPAVTEQHRHVLTGRAMDVNALSGLVALCYMLAQPGSPALSKAAAQHRVDICATAVARQTKQVSDLPSGYTVLPSHTGSAVRSLALHSMATAQEQLLSTAQRRDIWNDPQLLQFVLQGKILDSMHVSAVKALQRRSAHYRADAAGKIHRIMPDGSTRIVPSPVDREAIVRTMHVRTGHFGEKRTAHLLLTQFWWYGLFSDVYRVCRSCSLCRRTNADFNARAPLLQPLEIKGLFYRWGVDLCGEFLKTPRGNKYVMVCVEYFSKHVELIPLPDKRPETTAYAFLSNVLSRYGSCAEVVTDRGSEWRSSFDALLESCFIDHRTTAPNHPQADGLAERVVQTIKKGLRKHCEQCADVRGWDEGLCWIALGYRCSPQASTGFSPYELLYARRPVIPPAIMQQVTAPLSFDCSEAAAASLLERAKRVSAACPEAFGNLLIAQHRDSLRYAMVRSGSFQPTLVKFFPGQFVYVQRPNQANTLQIKARPEILRVVAVNPGGSVTLQGKCGTTTQQNMENLAPCFLPNIDPTIDPTLSHVSASHPCEVCRFVNRPGHMLLCDNCNTGWHIDCLTPKLPRVPDGVWACPYCSASGVDMAELAARQATNEHARAAAPVDIAPLFSLSRRRIVAEAEALHGRWLIYALPGPARTKVPTWGLIEFLGEGAYPRCLKLHFPTGVQRVVTVRLARKHVQGVNSKPPLEVQQAVPSIMPAVAAVAAAATSQLGTPTAAVYSLGHVTVRDLQCLVDVLNCQVVHTVFDPLGCGMLDLMAGLTSLASAQRLSGLADSPMPAPALSLIPAVGSGGDVAFTALKPPVPLVTLQRLCLMAPCVCVKLQGCAVSSLPLPVQLWLQQLQQRGRLQVVIGSIQAAGPPSSCTWLCIFSDAAARQAMVCRQHRTPTSLSYVALS